MWLPISASIIFITWCFYNFLLWMPDTTWSNLWIQVTVARKLRQPASTRPGRLKGQWVKYKRQKNNEMWIMLYNTYIYIYKHVYIYIYRYIPCHVSHEFVSYITFVSKIEAQRTDFTYSKHHLVFLQCWPHSHPTIPSFFLLPITAVGRAIRAPFWSKLLLQQKCCNINDWNYIYICFW